MPDEFDRTPPPAPDLRALTFHHRQQSLHTPECAELTLYELRQFLIAIADMPDDAVVTVRRGDAITDIAPERITVSHREYETDTPRARYWHQIDQIPAGTWFAVGHWNHAQVFQHDGTTVRAVNDLGVTTLVAFDVEASADTPGAHVTYIEVLADEALCLRRPSDSAHGPDCLCLGAQVIRRDNLDPLPVTL